MEGEHPDFRSMGILGIYKEAYKITVSWKKIFKSLTLALILPLSIIYLSQMQISSFILDKINHNQGIADNTAEGSSVHNRSNNQVRSGWIIYGLVNGLFLFLLLIFSVLSTTSIVYTIACIYTSTEISLKKVIKVVHKAWKKLTVTFLLCFFILAAYTGVTVGIVFLFATLTFGPEGEGANKVLIFLIVLSVPYFIGLIYIIVVWNIAGVVSVLEKDYGRKAIKKSIKLVKGKLWISIVIFTKFKILIVSIFVAFLVLVIYGNMLSVVGKVFVGILCYLLLTILSHFSLVTQTIVYFVCKAYHQEEISKSDVVQLE